LKEFEAKGAQVLSVSVDSVFSHKAFAEKIGGICCTRRKA
jgi:alkyl hydroperoxide reductase subunit AhpC